MFLNVIKSIRSTSPGRCVRHNNNTIARNTDSRGQGAESLPSDPQRGYLRSAAGPAPHSVVTKTTVGASRRPRRVRREVDQFSRDGSRRRTWSARDSVVLAGRRWAGSAARFRHACTHPAADADAVATFAPDARFQGRVSAADRPSRHRDNVMCSKCSDCCQRKRRGRRKRRNSDLPASDDDDDDDFSDTLSGLVYYYSVRIVIVITSRLPVPAHSPDLPPTRVSNVPRSTRSVQITF